MAMNLDEAQKQRVKAWIDEGLKLSEIQGKLDSELGVRLTYMELRFLMDDLSLKPQDPEPAKEETPKPEQPAPADSITPDEPDAGSGGTGSVSVSVDHVTRPGSVVSGRVTFSDGVSSEWYLDQMGRLGLVPSQAGYKPSQTDIMDFQAQLQRELAKQGF